MLIEVEPGIFIEGEFIESDTEAPAPVARKIEIAPYLVIVNRVKYQKLINAAQTMAKLAITAMAYDHCLDYQNHHTCDTGTIIARALNIIEEAKSRLAK